MRGAICAGRDGLPLLTWSQTLEALGVCVSSPLWPPPTQIPLTTEPMGPAPPHSLVPAVGSVHVAVCVCVSRYTCVCTFSYLLHVLGQTAFKRGLLPAIHHRHRLLPRHLYTHRRTSPHAPHHRLHSGTRPYMQYRYEPSWHPSLTIRLTMFPRYMNISTRTVSSHPAYFLVPTYSFLLLTF